MWNWLTALLAVSSPVNVETVAGPPHLCEGNCVITEAGLTLVKDFEGYHPCPYKDPIGLWTVGFGHLMGPDESRSKCYIGADADNLLRSDLAIAEKGVNRRVIIALLPYQFSAVVSWTFNLGEGALRKSTMLKRINAHRHVDVPSEMLRWNRAGGKVLRGLTRRRKAEGAMYRGE